MVLQKFAGYNDPTALKHTAPPLSADKLNAHLERLSDAMLLPFLHEERYSILKDWGNGLCNAMKKVAQSMKARGDSAAISLSEEVARCPENDAVCYIVEPSTSGRVALYKELSGHLENMDVYCVLRTGSAGVCAL